MGFQYDPDKAAANLKKHRVSLADSEGVIEDLYALRVEDPDATGEQRFVAIGTGSPGELLVVSYTFRGDDIRSMSARRASRKEREQYESGIRFFKR